MRTTKKEVLALFDIANARLGVKVKPFYTDDNGREVASVGHLYLYGDDAAYSVFRMDNESGSRSVVIEARTLAEIKMWLEGIIYARKENV